MTQGPGHDGELGVVTRYLDGVLHVAGEVDSASCRFLCDAIDAHRDDPLTLGFAAVSFCDSSCLGCILRAVRAGRHIIIVNPTPIVARVLAVVVGTGIPGLTIEP